MLVGLAPDENATAALHLGTLLARSTGEGLVVCSVVGNDWPTNPGQIDGEFRAFLDRRAHQALDRARARLDDSVDATFVVHHARSAPGGLLQVAREHDASLIVLGSSTAGAWGQVALGSATERITHSSHIPVAIAPRGFRCGTDTRVRRVTAGFGGGRAAHDLIQSAAVIAGWVGGSLRIASFAVRPTTLFAGEVAGGADDLVINEWIKGTGTAIRREIDLIPESSDVSGPFDVVVGQGFTWTEAIDDVQWSDGDIMAVGSSSSGPSARVFLGSRASKIMRHSPVPVVLIPRSADLGSTPATPAR